MNERIKLLEAWVNQNTYFKNHAGVLALLRSIEKEVSKVRARTEFVLNEVSEEAPQALKITLSATEDEEGMPLITFITHADTIFSDKIAFSKFQFVPTNGSETANELSETATHATGPGVIDDKGGIVIAVEAIKKLSILKERAFTVQLICMPGEEIGSPGFKNFLSSVGKQSALVLGFEPAMSDGSVIYSRRGNRWYEIKTRGPGGHAGRDAGKVVNPLTELCAKITELVKLNNGPRGVSVSPGAISTDTNGFNVIPTLATLKLDVRYNTNVVRDEVHAEILEIIKDTEWALLEDCPAMPLNGESEKLAKKAVELISHHEDRTATAHRAYGSSDCNYIWRAGIPILDGFGAVGVGLHTQQETIELKSLFTRTDIVHDLVLSFVKTHFASR
jgi:glutamate carboxypeptidase